MGTPAGSVEVLIEATTDGFNAAMDAAHDAVTGFVLDIPKLSALLAGALATGLAVATTKAANMEREMADVAVVMGEDLARRAIPEMTRSLRNLAIDLGHSEGLSRALFDTLRSGIPAADAMLVVEASGHLAEAAMTDVATAGDLVIRVLKAYKLGAQEAGKVSDIVFAAFRAGVSVDALSGSIAKILPIAKEAGVSFDELVSVVIALQDSGMDTTNAMRALNGIFNTLVDADSMPEVQSAAKRLGIEFNLAAVRSEGLASLLGKVRNASISSGVSLNRLFSESNAVKAVFALTGQNAANLERRLLDVANSSGSVNKALAVQDKTVKEMFESVVQLGSVALEIIGDNLLPAVQELLDAIMADKDDILAFAEDVGDELSFITDKFKYMVEHKDDLLNIFKNALSSTVGAVTAPFRVAKGAIGAGIDVMRFGGGLEPMFDGQGNLAAPPAAKPSRKGGGGGGTPMPSGGVGADYGPFLPGGQEDAQAGPSAFRVAWDDAFEKVFGSANQLSENIAMAMNAVTSTLSGSFQDLFIGLSDGTKSFGEIMQGIAVSFRNTMFKVISDVLAKWIMAHVLEMAMSKTAATSEIADAVAVGSAKSIAAHAGIPFVGLAIGIGAAAALAVAISQVAKLGTGGIGDKPTFAQLFENGKEAVIPLETQQGRKDLAAALREAGAGGSGGGNYTFHIQGTFLDGSPTMWDRVIRDHVIPAMDAMSLKTKNTYKTIT